MRALVIAIAVVLAAAALAALAAPGAALGDADPASDVLLIQRVFYPYEPAVPPALQRTLNAETAAAARAHFPIKVALLASRSDLGAIPELFAQPQRYAAFLDQEISFGSAQPLLVVMPNGYGVRGLAGPAAAVVPGLAKPADGAHLAQAAIVAVRRLATASGHPLPQIRGGPASGGGSGSRTLIIVVVVLAAVGIRAASWPSATGRSAEPQAAEAVSEDGGVDASANSRNRPVTTNTTCSAMSTVLSPIRSRQRATRTMNIAHSRSSTLSPTSTARLKIWRLSALISASWRTRSCASSTLRVANASLACEHL